MRRSIKNAAELVIACGRLYKELALSAAELLPASLRRAPAGDDLVLATES